MNRETDEQRDRLTEREMNSERWTHREREREKGEGEGRMVDSQQRMI